MRTGANIAIIFSLIFLPWWLAALLIVAAFCFISRFFEGIFYCIMLDALYGTRFGFYGLAYVFSILGVIIFSVTSLIRKRVVW
jgi:hypothetical protein